LGLVVVQRLLEAGGLLGIVDEDLLVGLALLPVALGVAGILQRLLIALPQLLVFRASSAWAVEKGSRLRQSIRQSRRCNMAHVSVHEKSP